MVGAVGVGKSALLLSLLGEMHHCIKSTTAHPSNQQDDFGTISSLVVNPTSSTAVVGRVAYVSQSAWLPSDTVKRAVEFGRNPETGLENEENEEESKSASSDDSFDDSWFRQVLSACQLDDDLKLFPAGANTEVLNYDWFGL